MSSLIAVGQAQGTSQTVRAVLIYARPREVSADWSGPHPDGGPERNLPRLRMRPRGVCGFLRQSGIIANQMCVGVRSLICCPAIVSICAQGENKRD